MLSRVKQNLLMTAAIVAVVGVCGGFISKPVMAQSTSSSLADSVHSIAAQSGQGINLDNAELAAMSSVDAQILEQERQAQLIAERARQDAIQKEEEHRRSSYKRASEGLMPLSEDQIRDFMKRLDRTQRAAQMTKPDDPKGEVKIASISLDPGVKPPVVNLAAGYVTTIDIIDQTGAPWPILDVGIGGNFEVTPTEAGSHVVRVVPLTRVGSGNLSIMLKDQPTPLIFRLVAGESKYHMRFDARVPKLGPNAKPPLIKHGINWPVAGDQVISMILENAPPRGAQRLKISGLDARTKAWKVGHSVYVRTPLSLLSPAWNASASSADGMTVYEIGNAPVLLMSDNGAMIRARLLQEDNYDK